MYKENEQRIIVEKFLIKQVTRFLNIIFCCSAKSCASFYSLLLVSKLQFNCNFKNRKPIIFVLIRLYSNNNFTQFRSRLKAGQIDIFISISLILVISLDRT